MMRMDYFLLLQQTGMSYSELLINAGINVNQLNNLGNNAVYKGYKEICELLVAKCMKMEIMH